MYESKALSSCEDDPLETLTGIESADDCLNECRSAEGCRFSTYDSYTRICVLTATCRERDPCADCVVAGADYESCADEE